MAHHAKPFLASKVEDMPRKKTTDARLTDIETQLAELKEQLSGLLSFLKDGRGFWRLVHQGFAGLGYFAATSVTIYGAWKLFFAH